MENADVDLETEDDDDDPSDVRTSSSVLSRRNSRDGRLFSYFFLKKEQE